MVHFVTLQDAPSQVVLQLAQQANEMLNDCKNNLIIVFNSCPIDFQDHWYFLFFGGGCYCLSHWSFCCQNYFFFSSNCILIIAFWSQLSSVSAGLLRSFALRTIHARIWIFTLSFEHWQQICWTSENTHRRMSLYQLENCVSYKTWALRMRQIYSMLITLVNMVKLAKHQILYTRFRKLLLSECVVI